jgi:hypothetical protein
VTRDPNDPGHRIIINRAGETSRLGGHLRSPSSIVTGPRPMPLSSHGKLWRAWPIAVAHNPTSREGRSWSNIFRSANPSRPTLAAGPGMNARPFQRAH